MTNNDMRKIINQDHKDPFSILGIHEEKNGVVIRCFLPYAKEVKLINKDNKQEYDMEKVDEKGFFELNLPEQKGFFNYYYRIKKYEDNIIELEDPYRFSGIITDFDLYLFNEGKNYRIFDKMGAHLMELNGVKGAYFAVWAPNAKAISVVGDFNFWDVRVHQMGMIKDSGVWEIFIPGVTENTIYKYSIKSENNKTVLKADPYGVYSESKLKTASIVYDIEGYKWKDTRWMEERSKGNPYTKPMSIYEVHLGSWKRKDYKGEDGIDLGYYSYREYADELVKYVKKMNYTHIELLPVCEHPLDASWGYQITGYFACNSRHGTPKDFMYFVDQCHKNNIGVILDWVPGHFPKDSHGLGRFDGTALYEHKDPRIGEHLEWGTYIFNYAKNQVRNFLISNALFWFEKYHIDGLRVDAVASMLYLDYNRKKGQWLPNKWGGKENVDAIEFLRELNSTVYQYCPGIMMIAEESTSWAMVCKPPFVGGLGFGFKWNMGWMNDFLSYMKELPVNRKYHHDKITFSICYAYSENFILVLSHDEVVHGKCSMINKMPGDYDQKFANLKVAYGFMFGHPGKKLMFMGDEFAQFIEWNFAQGLDWNLLEYEKHKKMQDFVRDLNYLYVTEKSLSEQDCCMEGFNWIDCSNRDSGVITFMRNGKEEGDSLIFVCNFSDINYTTYKVGVPDKGTYTEVLNSDLQKYGGNSKNEIRNFEADKVSWNGQKNSINLAIPPLSVLVLKKLTNPKKNDII